MVAVGHGQAVTLHGGDQLAVQVQVDIGEVGGGATVDHHLVEDELVGGGGGGLPLVLLLEEDAAEAGAEGEGGVALEHMGHLTLTVLELEGCEEAEAAEVEGHDGRRGLLEEGGGVEGAGARPGAGAGVGGGAAGGALPARLQAVLALGCLTLMNHYRKNLSFWKVSWWWRVEYARASHTASCSPTRSWSATLRAGL